MTKNISKTKKPTQAEIRKNRAFTAVLLIWKDDVATHLSQVGVATMLSFYCREKLNSGIIEDARTMLNNEILRGIMGLGKDGAEMVLNEESPFWEWDNDDLHVNYYSLFHENEIISKSKGGRKKKKSTDKNSVENSVKTINKEKNNMYIMSKEECCSCDSHSSFDKDDVLGKKKKTVKLNEKQSKFMESLKQQVENASNNRQNVSL